MIDNSFTKAIMRAYTQNQCDMSLLGHCEITCEENWKT